jgi:gamma-glutamylcyclotransferase (GGCT)/AIG2-like uncharacterized protein YtfP
MPLLFVYGTLKRGFPLHHHLGPSRFVAAARTGPGFALYRLDWYPAMVAEAEATGVTGELFEVSEPLLAVLDEVESVPYLYHRVQVPIVECDGEPRTNLALAYVYQQPVAGRERLGSGEWV